MRRKKKRLIRRIKNAITDLIAIALTGFLLMMVASQYEIGPLRFLAVQSGSMEPYIMTGDLAIINVQYDRLNSIKEGDVVLFDDYADQCYYNDGN